MRTKFNNKGKNALRNPWFYLVAVAVIVLLVVVVKPSSTGNVISNSDLSGFTDLSDDDAVLGNPDAPVTIVEFSDFECPFCARFVSQTLPKLKEKYIDTGKVKLIYRDFPLSFHPDAQKAAEAAESARELGGDEAYWAMHDKMFYSRDLSIASLKQYARDIGLNGEAFDKLLDSGKYSSEVNKDFRDGQRNGVSGTPTFFINGKTLVGAQPFEAFEQIIEAELND